MRAHHLYQPSELSVQGHGAGQSADGQARRVGRQSCGRCSIEVKLTRVPAKRKRAGYPARGEGRPTSPAASASGWRWPGRCCMTALCTSLTRPPPTSMWRAKTTSCAKSTAWHSAKTVILDFPPAGQRGRRQIPSMCLDNGTVCRTRQPRANCCNRDGVVCNGFGTRSRALENYGKEGDAA